jgi:hypothetical protein
MVLIIQKVCKILCMWVAGLCSLTRLDRRGLGRAAVVGAAILAPKAVVTNYGGP